MFQGLLLHQRLERKFQKGVDGNAKRYRMGGSPRNEMFEGNTKKVLQVIDL
jgi:hypothetical protein